MLVTVKRIDFEGNAHESVIQARWDHDELRKSHPMYLLSENVHSKKSTIHPAIS